MLLQSQSFLLLFDIERFDWLIEIVHRMKQLNYLCYRTLICVNLVYYLKRFRGQHFEQFAVGLRGMHHKRVSLLQRPAGEHTVDEAVFLLNHEMHIKNDMHTGLP